MKIKTILEDEPIDFHRAKRKKDDNDMFAHQERMEQVADHKSKEIFDNARLNALPYFQSPTFGKNIKKIPAFEWFQTSLPNPAQVKQRRHLDKTEKFALSVLRDNYVDIKDAAFETLAQFKELDKWADNAPDPEYVKDNYQPLVDKIEFFLEIITMIGDFKP